MKIKNNWDTFEIENLTFNFNKDYHTIIVTFDFKVIKSYSYLEKTFFENIEMEIENNLPYTMLLEKIFEKCENTIDNE